jgi:integrase
VYDAKTPGLLVRVTDKGVKSFTVYRRINGRPQRVKLGRYPDMSIEQARNSARQTLGLIASGVDPIAKRRADKVRGVTLGEVFESYLKGHDLKPGTVRDYRRVMAEAFPDWLDKPMLAISKDMVERRHQMRGERSKARANNAMRVLRALFNFAVARYEDAEGQPLLKDNPVKRISSTRAWYRVERRQSLIKDYQLSAWFRAVQGLKAERDRGKADMARDYFLLIIFTGLRKEEAAKLRWANIDFEACTFTIRDTKNRDVHVLPLPSFIYDLLSERRQDVTSPYVFPGIGDSENPCDLRYWIDKVTAESGIKFTLHDLRRTFITTAESLDISVYALKRLLNHRIDRSDVTAGYIITDVERLRKPMQKINDHLLHLINMEGGAAVVDIRRASS